MSRLSRFLFQGILLTFAFLTALVSNGAIMEFDLPDPNLPFKAPWPTNADVGEWTAIPVLVSRTVMDPVNLIVTPGDPLDPSGRVSAGGNTVEGLDYDIAPGEPITFLPGDNTPQKGRFYFRTRRTALIETLAERIITLYASSSSGRSSLPVRCTRLDAGITSWVQMHNTVILTGTTDSRMMWVSQLARLPVHPTAPVVMQLKTVPEIQELVTIPLTVNGVIPYGPATPMDALPQVGGTAPPVWGNGYYAIPITPTGFAQSGDMVEIEITALKVGDVNINLIGRHAGTVRFVDRILMFDSVKKYAGPKATVTEGDVYSVKFSLSSGYKEKTTLFFKQDPGTERDATPSSIDGVPTAHPDFVGGTDSGSILVWNNGNANDSGVTMESGKTEGTLVVKTTNNQWFDPYRVLKIVPFDEELAPTYLVNPSFELTINNLGAWPKVSFAQNEMIVPAGIQKADIPLVVNQTSADDYLVSVITTGSGGMKDWTRRAQTKFEPNLETALFKVALPNLSGKDVSITYHISKTMNATPGNRRSCKVTVLGMPSTVEMITQPVGTVDEGKAYTVTLEMDKARSHDVTFSLTVLPHNPALGTPAIEGRDFIAPPSVTIKAGAKRVSFKIQTSKTYNEVSDVPLAFKIGFSSIMPRNVSWKGGISPTVQVGIRQLNLGNGPSTIWFPVSKTEGEIGLVKTLYVGFNNGASGDIKLSSGTGKGDQKIQFGITQADNSLRWVDFLDLKGVGETPVPFVYRISNGYNYGGKFKIQLLAESGAYKGKITFKVNDYRPDIKTQRYDFIGPTGLQELFPLRNSQNTEMLANNTQLTDAYNIDNPYQPDTYRAAQAPDGGGFVYLPNLTPQRTSIELTALGLTDSTTYGQVKYVYGGVSPYNNPSFNNQVSASEILLTVGGDGLRRAPGFTIPSGTVFPQNARSVWANYLDPFASYKNMEKVHKASFGMKRDPFGQRYAYCRGTVRLYSPKEIRQLRKEGVYSDFVSQVETIPLSMAYRADSAVETNYKYFVFRPMIDDMQTWGDDSLPAAPVAEDWRDTTISRASFNTICHPGSIIRVTGRYFGNKPKVVIESYQGGANSIVSVACKIMSVTETTVNGVLQEIMLVRLPTSLPASWVYDPSNIVLAASSNTRMVINSGSGLTGAQIILKPFSAGNDDNEAPSAYMKLDSPIAVGTFNGTPYIEIPITMKSFQSTYFPRAFLSNDQNSDELMVSKVKLEEISYLQGSAKIINGKNSEQSIRFTPKKGSFSGRIRVFFEVKERFAGRAGLSKIGCFVLEYNN